MHQRKLQGWEDTSVVKVLTVYAWRHGPHPQNTHKYRTGVVGHASDSSAGAAETGT